jgi:hypothetical protein
MQAIVIQADAAGDEVRVNVCLMRAANQFDEIAPGKWFASGKTDLQNAKRGSSTNDPFPFFCRELAITVAAARWAAWRFAQRSGYGV